MGRVGQPLGPLVIALLAVASSGSAPAATTTRVAAGLTQPVFATAPPGDADRLFVVERMPARIRIIDLATDTLRIEPFLTIPGVIGEGLLGLAFHPEHAITGRLYVYYVAEGGTNGMSVVEEYVVEAGDPERADPGSARTVLSFDQPQASHNGGWIGFGPDGYLYIMTGDGGGQHDSAPGHTPGTGNAQDITANLLGKVLRIDVNGDDFPGDAERNYAIPADNPFLATEGDDEIWAYGLRNPFRASFDRQTGDLYIADVGQFTREEIDFQPAGSAGGENYGWRLREGTIPTPTGGLCPDSPDVTCPRPPGNVDPVFEYDRNSGSSVTGGYVYRGPIASLQGHYFFADFISDRIWSFRFDGSDPASFDGMNVVDLVEQTEALQPPPGQGSIGAVAGFGEDAEGNLYLLDLQDGELFRVVLGCDEPEDLDCDGLPDSADLCPYFASGEQADTNGDGIGDACECGDQTGDGLVDVRDVLAINRVIFDLEQVNPLCDTNEDGRCNVADILGVNAKIFGAEAYCARFPSP